MHLQCSLYLLLGPRLLVDPVWGGREEGGRKERGREGGREGGGKRVREGGRETAI